uniref:Uncharacterized protein n=1 Tax=Oryza nivara TaxID=4536 RepID=A0A0E0IBL5_ORYNI
MAPAENEAERRRTGSSQSPARMSPRRDAPVVMGAKTATRWERVTAAWTGSGGERRRRQQRTAPAVADEDGANEVGRREAAENVVEGMVGEHCGGGNLTAATPPPPSAPPPRLLLRRRSSVGAAATPPRPSRGARPLPLCLLLHQCRCYYSFSTDAAVPPSPFPREARPPSLHLLFRRRCSPPRGACPPPLCFNLRRHRRSASSAATSDRRERGRRERRG